MNSEPETDNLQIGDLVKRNSDGAMGNVTGFGAFGKYHITFLARDGGHTATLHPSEFTTYN